LTATFGFDSYFCQKTATFVKKQLLVTFVKKQLLLSKKQLLFQNSYFFKKQLFVNVLASLTPGVTPWV